MASEKAPVKLAKKDVVYVGVILVLAVVLAFTLLQNMIASSSQQSVLNAQQKVLDNVQNVYKNLTESNVEVVSVKDEGYLYRILLRLKLPEGDALREVYATKDGKYFSEAGNVIEVSSFMERLDSERSFANCLKARGFVVVGQKSEPNTVQQLLTIGNFANRVYFECSGENLQACQQIGIQAIPTIFYNKMNYTGVKSREWIESLTGCK
jgi:hypothetical protein